jgi:hypothetical protein
LVFSVTHAQYIGWGTKKIKRNIRWECDCRPEAVKVDDKYIVEFSNELGVTKMVFYMEEDETCYGYSVYCDNDYEKTLREFIEENYEYNIAEDYYENKKSYLFYQSDKKKKIIHVIDKNASYENAKPFSMVDNQ